MSQEPYPRTDKTTPGSTPAEGPGARTESERQRARGDLPGRPTRDPLDDRRTEAQDSGADQEEATGDATEERVEVPPTETVPDEVAERATRSIDPRTGVRREPGEKASEEDPMHPASSTDDVRGMPRGSEQ